MMYVLYSTIDGTVYDVHTNMKYLLERMREIAENNRNGLGYDDFDVKTIWEVKVAL